MTFFGYERPDGRVGVRNYVLILPASVCASDTTRIVAQQVNGAVTFNNQQGCSQVGPDQQLTMDVMAGYAANPNIYGTVVVSLGCENCQMDLVVKNGKIVDAVGADGPSNHGLLCVKGRSGSFDFVDSPERIRYPLIKNKATGEFERATWEEALSLTASKFTEIKNQYGGEALAGFACSRSANEDIYMLQKMVRTVFQSNNTDNCARV